MVGTGEEQRTIGLAGATGIGLGAIVGGGILALAGVAYAEAGPAAILAFLLNGVIATFTALSFSEMASAFPENGGAYAFTRKVLSVRAAFAVGWVLLFASVAAAVLYALGFAAYALEAGAELARTLSGEVPTWMGSRWTTLSLAGGAVLFYSLLLLRKAGGNGQWETVGKIVLLLLIVLGGLVAMVQETPAQVSDRLTPFMPNGFRGVVTAMGFTFITLQGFDIIATVGGEIRRPQRTLPRAMLGSLGFAIALYIPLLLVIATVGVGEGESITELAKANPETLMASAVRRFLGRPGYWLVLVAAVLAMLSALAANLLAASRITSAMARDRTLPRGLSVTSGKREVPVRATLGVAAVVLLLLFTMQDVAGAGAAASLIFLLSFALTHVTTILARSRTGGTPGAFRTPWFPLVPLAGLASCAGLAVFQGLQVPSAGVITTAWLALGFLLYFTSLSDRAEVVDARSEAMDPDLARLRGRNPLVLVPMANPHRARALVEVADALSVPRVGRVLLLSVVVAGPEDDAPRLEHAVTASQGVLREAMLAAAGAQVRAEALVTLGADPWSEIARVAGGHRCAGLLLGLGAVSDPDAPSPLERLLEHVACDVFILGAPPGWHLARVRSVLVPVAGGGGHDEIRARLLASLVRAGASSITFFRVVPEVAAEVDIARIRRSLTEQAEDEVPIPPAVEVVCSDDPVPAILDAAQAHDVVVLGIQRMGKQRLIGTTARRIAAATPGAVILISHRVAPTGLLLG